MRIAIIGAGIAGLSCAHALRAQGHAPTLFDKGRGAGGRMSTRRLDTPLGEAAFDHGAQYFTARDPAFVAQVARWAREGHVARWPAAGDDAWVGTPGMNAPVRALAEAADVHWSTRIDALSHHEGQWHLAGEGLEVAPFDAAIVAVPSEQVAALVEAHDPETANLARATQSAPCWTVMVAYATRLPGDHDRLSRTGILDSAVRNSAKPARTGPEAWVLQADADWSRTHLEDDPADVQRALLATLATSLAADLPAPVATSVHRWRYAKAGTLARDALWDADQRLGLCGDWLLAPRVEAAWLSGLKLAQRIG